MRAPLAAVALLLLTAACFDESAPTSQVGGTQFSLRLSVPSPVRVPSGAVAIFQRSPTTLRVIDSVTVSNVALLEPLRGPARYQFWVVNSLDESARPVRAAITRTRTDTTFNATGGVTTTTVVTNDGARAFYEGSPLNTVATFKIGPNQSADSVGQTAAFLVLTIQADTAAPEFTATTPKPLWFRLRDQRGTAAITDDVISANGNLAFGTFVSAASQRPFSAQGFGRGAIWDEFADGRLHLSALAFGLTQPPLGYHYVPVIRNDSLGRVTSLGDVVDAVTRESQRDADLRPVTGSVAQLPNVRFRARDDTLQCAAAGCAYPGFMYDRVVQLLLEPKLGHDSIFGITSVLQGSNNLQLVDTRSAARGTVEVMVAGTNGPVAGAVVALYGSGGTTVLASGTTNAEGVVVFSNLPPERIDVRLVPSAGITTERYLRGLDVLPGETLNVVIQL